MFRLCVQFHNDADLLGKKTFGIDGSNFKAVNSRKNNYNQNKMDKHQEYIADKVNKYLQKLNELDKQKNTILGDELKKKEENA